MYLDLFYIVATSICVFLYFYLVDYCYYILPYDINDEDDVFGARIDRHSPLHFYAGVFITYHFNVELAFAVNFLWELWDYFKSKKPISNPPNATLIDKSKVFLYNNILVSEGRFDIMDFGLMALGSCIVHFMKSLM